MDKKIYLAIGVVGVISILALIFSLSRGGEIVRETIREQLGGISTVRDELSKGAIIGNSSYFIANGTIKGAENEGFFRNTEGRTIYVRMPIISMINNSSGIGKASSTFDTYMASTTASTFPAPANFHAPTTTPLLIQGFRISTSTRVGSLESVAQATSTLIIPLIDGAYLNFALISPYKCGANTTATNCESATSTNRGFDLLWEIPYTYNPK